MTALEVVSHSFVVLVSSFLVPVTAVSLMHPFPHTWVVAIAVALAGEQCPFHVFNVLLAIMMRHGNIFSSSQ